MIAHHVIEGRLRDEVTFHWPCKKQGLEGNGQKPYLVSAPGALGSGLAEAEGDTKKKKSPICLEGVAGDYPRPTMTLKGLAGPGRELWPRIIGIGCLQGNHLLIPTGKKQWRPCRVGGARPTGHTESPLPLDQANHLFGRRRSLRISQKPRGPSTPYTPNTCAWTPLAPRRNTQVSLPHSKKGPRPGWPLARVSPRHSPKVRGKKKL